VLKYSWMDNLFNVVRKPLSTCADVLSLKKKVTTWREVVHQLNQSFCCKNKHLTCWEHHAKAAQNLNSLIDLNELKLRHFLVRNWWSKPNADVLKTNIDENKLQLAIANMMAATELLIHTARWFNEHMSQGSWTLLTKEENKQLACQCRRRDMHSIWLSFANIFEFPWLTIVATLVINFCALFQKLVICLASLHANTPWVDWCCTWWATVRLFLLTPSFDGFW